MNLNEKQVEALKKELGEKRFNELTGDLNSIEYNCDKIYFYESYGYVYKLHEFSRGQFAWIDMSNSECLANGLHNSPEKALNYVDNYQEFNNMKEAIESGIFN